MSEHRVEVEMPAAGVDVLSLFDARPASWIRSFLVLAAREHVGRSEVRQPPWYRVGRIVGHRAGSYEVSFTWWPHLSDPIFSCFRGTFRLMVAEGRVVFGLSGEAIGGTEENNQHVVADLVRLLAAAIGAAPTTDS